MRRVAAGVVVLWAWSALAACSGEQAKPDAKQEAAATAPKTTRAQGLQPADPVGGPEAKPAGQVKGGAPASPPPPMQPARRVILRTGTLVFKPLPRGKSARAYHGITWYLKASSGRLSLIPTTLVTAAQLKPLVGKRVTITAEEFKGTMPRPDESYPTGMDGKPIPRGAGWKLQSVKLAAAKAKQRTETGTLVYDPPPPRKSLRAYHGISWFLKTSKERLPLKPTDQVTKKTLEGLKGATVEVTLEWYAGRAPDPRSQHPVAFHPVKGRVPVLQGRGWKVLSIKKR